VYFLQPEGYARLLPSVFHYAEAQRDDEDHTAGPKGRNSRAQSGATSPSDARRPSGATGTSRKSAVPPESDDNGDSGRARAVIVDKDAVAGLIGPLLLLFALMMNTAGK
jgi:hypothetical protein